MNGLLASVTDLDGRITTIHRENGKLASIEGPFGHVTTFELYDSGTHKGYIKTIAGPAGTVHLEYASESYKEGLLTKLIDPKGYEFAFEYTGNGRLKKHIDPPEAGGIRTFEHKYLPFGTGFKVTAQATAGIPLVTTYSIENLITGAQKRTVLFPDGLSAETMVEPNGTRITTYPDGTKATLIDKGDPRFGMQAPVVSSLQTQTGGLTQTIERERTYTPGADSTVASLTDMVRINGKTLTTTYAAQPAPTITRTTPAGRTSITELDADGRAIKTVVKLLPNDPIQLHPTVYTYYQDLPHKGRLHTVTHSTGLGARTYTFFYNDQGDLDSVQDPLGRTASYQYYPSGRVRIKTLPDGSIVELWYDANGNITEVASPRLPAEPVPVSSDLHHFLYGPLDFVTTYTPPKADDWLTMETTAQYTPNRLLDKMIKPVGMLIDRQYDSFARLESIAGQQALSFSYYPLNAPGDHRRKLQAITSSPLSPDEITLGYTYQGNLLKTTTWSGPVSGQVEWTYDNDFQVTSETVQGSAPIQFHYADTDRLLTKAGDFSLIRDPATGILTGAQIGNLTETYGYNKFGELSDYEVKVSGTTKYAVHYTLRDGVGRVLRKTESISGEPSVTYEYAYGDLGELTDVYQGAGPCNQTTCVHTGHYEYTLNGNRTLVQVGRGQTISDIQHDAQDRLTKYGTTTFQHYPNGEVAQKTLAGQGTTTYTWDVFGNLRRVELPNGSVIDYLIDGQNRRVGKKVDGVLVKGWLYDGPAPVAELDKNEAITARFVYATKVHVPDYVVKPQEGKTYRLITDQLGSVRLLLDIQTGAIAQKIAYDEFGRVLSDSTQGFQPFGYAGGLYDADTGLVRFGARDYDAETGRWLAKDPILFAGGDTNLYAYAGNDPINHIDPDGLVIQNVAMNSALGGGVLSWLGFGTIAEGLKNRADGILAMSNPATVNQGLQKYRQGICQIGAGAMQAAGTMQMVAGALTIGAVLAARGGATAYSVAFETTIPKVGAGSRGAHFKAANEALLAEMRANPASASAIDALGIRVPTTSTGTALPRSPAGWTWHHVPDRPGVMQLVPTAQHQGGPWQPLLHPGGVGRFKLWGADF